MADPTTLDDQTLAEIKRAKDQFSRDDLAAYRQGILDDAHARQRVSDEDIEREIQKNLSLIQNAQAVLEAAQSRLIILEGLRSYRRDHPVESLHKRLSEIEKIEKLLDLSDRLGLD